MRINAERLVTPPETPETPVAPDPVLRPALALWLFERGLDTRQAGELFGCSHGQIHIICKPFDDPEWRPPRLPLLERIVLVTRGEITGEDFIPPHVRKPPPAVELADEVQSSSASEERRGDPNVLRQARAM